MHTKENLFLFSASRCSFAILTSGSLRRGYYRHSGLVACVVCTGVKLQGGIPADLRSGTSYSRSTTSNNGSCSSQLRSGTFLLGSTTLLGRIQASYTIVWRRGVVDSGVRRMNEVNARRARLLPGWVTVFGRIYHLGM